MPFRLGPWEIGLILMVILIVFGAGKLPQVGSVLGKSIGAFRRAQRDESDGDDAGDEAFIRSKAGKTLTRKARA